MKTGTYILAASLLAASLLALSLALMQSQGRAKDHRILPQDYNDELLKRILHLDHVGPEKAKIEREKIAEGFVSQGDEAIPKLEKYLGHKQWRVRYFAVTVLGHIKGVKSTHLLLRAVHESQQNAIQVAAMRGLQGRPLETDDLVRLLTHENREVETMALESLENIEIDETLLSVLSKQLSGPDWRIRCQVARIVGRHKEIPAKVKVALVLPALKEETRNSRGAALLPGSYANESEFIKVQYHFSLEAMGEPAIPFLREARLTAEGELAERISIVLGYLGDQSAYGALVKILTDEENS